jgi:dUTP pyrophosphatase
VIELPVRRLREDATLPAQAYAGDAGFDLAACGRHEVRPGERAVIPTGVAVEIPEGYGGFVLPRSGIAARNGITLLNAPGLIDSGYRGEVKVVFHNADPAETFVVEPGMRIAQLVLLPVPEVRVVEHDQLAASERGERGFGSSRA